jgi:hypothetical protein
VARKTHIAAICADTHSPELRIRYPACRWLHNDIVRGMARGVGYRRASRERFARRAVNYAHVCFRVRDSADFSALVGSPVQVSRSCCPSSRSRLLHGSVICGTVYNFSEEHSFGRFLLRAWASWLKRKSLPVRPPRAKLRRLVFRLNHALLPKFLRSVRPKRRFSQGCGEVEPRPSRI